MRNGSPPSYVLVPCRTDYEPISDTLHDMNHWVVGLKREDDVSAETFENMQRQDLEDKLAAVDAHCEPSMADDIKRQFEMTAPDGTDCVGLATGKDVHFARRGLMAVALPMRPIVGWALT